MIFCFARRNSIVTQISDEIAGVRVLARLRYNNNSLSRLFASEPNANWYDAL